MKLNLFRGPANGSFDVSRILWALSVLAGIGYTGAHLYLNKTFSIIEFGTGMGLLMAGAGGATALKDAAVAKVNGGSDS